MKRLLRRLRPYGPVLPVCHGFKAWLLGIGDGWRQPFDLSTSTNVEHLESEDRFGVAQEGLDRGINLGQWLRSPLNHQRMEA